jgi:hypothetical protein
VGFLAGWGFVIGKTASCAAMALTFAAYAAPGLERPPAVAAIVALAAVNYRGVTRTARLTRVIVAVVLVALAVIVLAGLVGGEPRPARLGLDLAGPGWYGVLQSAGLLFFAFAGYARIATMGEEVAEPERTIPRAIQLALGITVAGYAAVALTLLAVLGPGHRGRACSARRACRRRTVGVGGAGGAGGWGCGRAGRPAVADRGRRAHRPGDGPPAGPAVVAGRRAPALPGAAPRRGGSGLGHRTTTSAVAVTSSCPWVQDSVVTVTETR